VRLFLGVDGGQTGTTAIVGDETGRVVRIDRAGPCSPESGCAAALRECAGDDLFESACFGFSGGWENKEAIVRSVVRASKFVFAHDALIALMGATAGNPGIITIAGTGSMIFGRNAEGREARAGGWGFVFGDEGSAFDIVRQALRAALRFEEGWGSPTALRSALLESTGAGDANELLHLFYTTEWPRARIASLARVVDECARAGDRVARDVLNGAAQSLAMYASAVRAQLFPTGALVSYVGGVFRSEIVLQRFRSLIELENRLEAPRFGPAAGALMEAYRAAGIVCELEASPQEKF
jgi:N-acetylglucosamine kinase-like BadF-type ATPase